MDALLEFLSSITRWASDDPNVRKKRAWIFFVVLVATASVIAFAVVNSD